MAIPPATVSTTAPQAVDAQTPIDEPQTAALNPDKVKNVPDKRVVMTMGGAFTLRSYDVTLNTTWGQLDVQSSELAFEPQLSLNLHAPLPQQMRFETSASAYAHLPAGLGGQYELDSFLVETASKYTSLPRVPTADQATLTQAGGGIRARAGVSYRVDASRAAHLGVFGQAALFVGSETLHFEDDVETALAAYVPDEAMTAMKTGIPHIAPLFGGGLTLSGERVSVTASLSAYCDVLQEPMIRFFDKQYDTSPVEKFRTRAIETALGVEYRF